MLNIRKALVPERCTQQQPKKSVAKSLLICLEKRTLTYSLYKLLPGYYIFMTTSFYKLSGNFAIHINNVLQNIAFFVKYRARDIYIKWYTEYMQENLMGASTNSKIFYGCKDFVSFSIIWLNRHYKNLTVW